VIYTTSDKHGKTRLHEVSSNAKFFSPFFQRASNIFLERLFYNSMILWKEFSKLFTEHHRVSIVELRKCSSQARNLIPIESEHTKAAKRGENKVHSWSVLKFQKAKVGVIVTKILSFFLYTWPYTFRPFLF